MKKIILLPFTVRAAGGGIALAARGVQKSVRGNFG